MSKGDDRSGQYTLEEMKAIVDDAHGWAARWRRMRMARNRSRTRSSPEWIPSSMPA